MGHSQNDIGHHDVKILNVCVKWNGSRWVGYLIDFDQAGPLEEVRGVDPDEHEMHMFISLVLGKSLEAIAIRDGLITQKKWRVNTVRKLPGFLTPKNLSIAVGLINDA